MEGYAQVFVREMCTNELAMNISHIELTEKEKKSTGIVLTNSVIREEGRSQIISDQEGFNQLFN